MSSKIHANSDTSDREIIITRVFDAPRELVWQAMTDPQHVVHWWGPRGFSTTIETMDVRPGGIWKHTMHGPDGANYPNESVFEEVVKPERIVYSHGGRREGGPGVRFRSTWRFEVESAGRTKVTIHMVFPTPQQRDFVVKEFGAIEGGKQTLARLGEFLAGSSLTVERSFDAPIELVWKAITDPAQMKQWYMPQIASFAPVVGFETKFSVHHNGRDFVHLWRVAEVVLEKKISYTWKYDGFPGESLVTFELFAEQGKTRLRLSHTGLESFQPDKHPELARANFLAGWASIADQLAAYVTKR